MSYFVINYNMSIPFPCFFFFQNKAITTRVRNLSDTVVGLESFIGSERETNPLYKDYHGKHHLYHEKNIY